MADYSYVILRIDPTIPPTEAEAIIRAECEDFIEWEGPIIDASDAGSGHLEITVEEARYGDSIYLDRYHPTRTPMGVAIDQGWAFTCHDGGSYEWGPWDTGWRPGMTEVVYRHTTSDGEAVLTHSEWNKVLESEAADPIAAIARHFGEDPDGWLGHRISIDGLNYKEEPHAVSQ